MLDNISLPKLRKELKKYFGSDRTEQEIQANFNSWAGHMPKT
jgi:hypothetical protein